MIQSQSTSTGLPRLCLTLAVAIFLISIIGGSRSSLAETSIGGRIDGNVTWRREQSPFLVNQNIEVPADSQLTLEPGVEVRLLEQTITVRGVLIARGTEELPVRFTSAKGESAAPMDWGIMTFEGAASGAIHDQEGNYVSGSILQHTIVEYGGGLVFNLGAPAIVDCTVRYNRKKRGGGIYAHGCKPIIRRTRISGNIADEEGGGIRTAYCEPIFLDNIIVHNGARYDGGGISIDHNVARIEGNTISHNYASHGGGISTGETQVGQTSVTGSSHSKPTILRNKITNNKAAWSGGGIYVQGSPIIHDNIIAGNRVHYTQWDNTPSSRSLSDRKVGTGAGIRVTKTVGGPLSIEQNIIAGNRGAFWGAALAFDEASGKISNNLIVNNQALLSGGGASLLLRTSSESLVGKGHGASWNFEENVFKGNSGGVFEFSLTKFNKGKQSVRVAKCNLAENEGTLFLNRTATEVQAVGNYWGTTDTQAIGELVTDFYDNNKLGRVRVQAAANPIEISGLPEISQTDLAFLSAFPEGLRAGQGFNRLPDTPPSVTITWNAGKLVDPTGYKIHLTRVLPRYSDLEIKSDLRVAAKCNEGESSVDVGNVNRTVLSGLIIGETYEFTIIAYDSNGLESSQSDSFVVKVER